MTTTTPPVPLRDTALTVAACTLSVLAGFASLLALGATAVGLLMVGKNLLSPDDDWATLGVIAGAAIAFGAGIVAAICWAVCRGTLHGLDDALDAGRSQGLVGAAIAGCAVGTTALVSVLGAGDADPLTWGLAALPGGLLASGATVLGLCLERGAVRP